MALREIRKQGDPVLAKECKPVKEMTPRLRELIEDMFDTMYEGGGCGLAAPQVGILKQIFVMDVDDGNQYVLINPEIVEKSGTQTGDEGCLSLPGYVGTVTRAGKVTVRGLDENMQPVEITGEELLARCIQHEYDHLHGHFYTELVEGKLRRADEEQEADSAADHE